MSSISELGAVVRDHQFQKTKLGYTALDLARRRRQHRRARSIDILPHRPAAEAQAPVRTASRLPDSIGPAVAKAPVVLHRRESERLEAGGCDDAVTYGRKPFRILASPVPSVVRGSCA